jgi:hypothetical protein
MIGDDKEKYFKSVEDAAMWKLAAGRNSRRIGELVGEKLKLERDLAHQRKLVRVLAILFNRNCPYPTLFSVEDTIRWAEECLKNNFPPEQKSPTGAGRK